MLPVAVRHDYSIEEIRAIHDLPLFGLMDRARDVHRQTHAPDRIQLCSLLSIKTGGCPEDCGYCAQSARYRTSVEPERLLDHDTVVHRARIARDRGASRFCMGAAWKGLREGESFELVLRLIESIKALGIETCCSMGEVSEEQACRLRDAGLDAYNHNIDTSPRFYKSIVTTRTFDQRMQTLRAIQRAGIRVCTGGIIGMGESIDDRCGMLQELARLDPHPDSVPINALIPIAGTPLEKLPAIDPMEMVRMVAAARVVMPHAMVRLSAGRALLSRESQLMCLYAGANSIFYGDKLLTADNASPCEDDALLRVAGLRPMEAKTRGQGTV
jgi:biotin synthase